MPSPSDQAPPPPRTARPGGWRKRFLDPLRKTLQAVTLLPTPAPRQVGEAAPPLHSNPSPANPSPEQQAGPGEAVPAAPAFQAGRLPSAPPPSWMPPRGKGGHPRERPPPLSAPATTTAPQPAAATPSARRPETRTIALALQGGGAHGAFGWGVVDRLLDEPDVRLECLSGTSAGAINAAVCAHGLLTGGRRGAQERLGAFWRKVARAGALTPFRRSWLDHLEGNWSLDHSPWLAMMDVARQFVSPYQVNPLGLNPLQELLEELVDFPVLRGQSRIGVYVAATNVHTGHETIFGTGELDARRVMASACLPFLFQAVEIDGVPYWDGGYLCNPPLMPLLSHATVRDLVIVPINPGQRTVTPRTARDILNRLNEITFNSSLHQDLETLRLINQLIDSGQLAEGEHRRFYLHVLDDDHAMRQLSATSKFNTEWEFLQYLHQVGHRAADRWLAGNRGCLGRRDSAMATSRAIPAEAASEQPARQGFRRQTSNGPRAG